MYKALLALFLGVVLLQGCSGMRVVDSQVSSFAPAPVPSGSRYRFERLPSQQVAPAAQDALEAMAQEALDQVGLVHDDQGAAFTVQVSATQHLQQELLERPLWGWNPGWRRGYGAWAPFPGPHVRTSYWREVGLTIRNNATQQVVFESHATNDGTWADSEAVLPAMLDAALEGFPTPPSGVRRVDIEIAR
jgi:hypothetical protein